MKKNKAVSAGIGYTLGNILIKGINFLSIPVFSRLLTTEEFGVYNVFISYEAILYVVVGMALHSCLRSANIKYKGKIDEFTSSISIIYLINCLILLILGLLFNGSIHNITDFSLVEIILLVFYSFSTALLALYNNRIAIDYEYKDYLFVSLLNTLGNVFISLFLVLTLFRSQKDLGRIIGVVFTSCSLAFLVLSRLYRKAKPKIRKEYWKFAIKYSLPIIPHGISQVILSQFDRIMISSICGSSYAGIYSLAGNIQLILTIITDSISNAWSTWFYENFKQEDLYRIQKRAVEICSLFLICSILLITISPELILILGGEKYNLAKFVAIPMIISAFLLFIYNIIVVVEYYYGKTVFIMTGTIIATIINLITNYIFIHLYGFIAAAYTTLFSYFCFLLIHIFISHRIIDNYIIRIRYLFSFLIVISCIAIFDLININNLILRWSIGIVISLIIFFILLKNKDKSKEEC